ncbi:MAG TPA: lysophospholipid acyltransferase family protein, partial [Acidimicrobiia bacterium]|nr:lysophospholipid acyltransferase family protein [Acidimicrobiia bacterium]
GVFGIYPEGTRSRDGDLHRGHTGVARLALRSGAPIVPVGLVGTRDVQPPDRTLPRFFQPITVKFGTPIDATRFAGREDDRMVLRQITDEVMFEIRALSGQRYSDTYATKKAEDVPSEPATVATLPTPQADPSPPLAAAGS